jgi:hypothetical protein
MKTNKTAGIQSTANITGITTVQSNQPLPERLSKTEKEQLAKCEDIIENSFDAFKKTTQAFFQIQSGKLYRDDYTSMQDYCQERWGFNRSYGYRLAATGELIIELEKHGDKYLPENETQAREILKVKPEKQIEVLDKAIEKANGKKPNSKQITEARKEIEAEEVTRENESDPTEAVEVITPAPEEDEAEEVVAHVMEPLTAKPVQIPPANSFRLSFTEMYALAEKIYNILSNPQRKPELETAVVKLKQSLSLYKACND